MLNNRRRVSECVTQTAMFTPQPRAGIECFITIGLALSTLVAIGTVSIGMARAGILIEPPDAAITPVTVTAVVVLFGAMAGLAAMMLRSSDERP
jgi:hypothetical protein